MIPVFVYHLLCFLSYHPMSSLLMQVVQNMYVTRKNLAPLKAELKKKKEENFELKSLIRSLKEKVRSKNEENMFLFE